MMKPMKKIASSLLLFGLLFFPFQNVHAEDDVFTGGCITSDYLDFVINNVHYKGNKDLGIESSRLAYITDIWQLSYCQVLDVLELYDELESLRDAYRGAAAACSNTAEYKERYKEIMLELYFIRRIQPAAPGLLRQYDIANLEARQEAELIRLEEEMVDLFVNDQDYIDEGVLRLYFDELAKKYEDKIANYRKCDEGPWAQVQEPFVSFVETMKELQEFGQDLEVPNYKEIYSMDTLKGGEGGGLQGVVKINDGGITNTVQEAFGYFKTRREQKQSELEQPIDVADLGGIETSESSSSSSTFTIEEALQTIESSEVNYATKDRHNDRLASYQVLYGQGGAQAATDLAGIVSVMNATVEHSNTVDFPQITVGATKIYDKQCR